MASSSHFCRIISSCWHSLSAVNLSSVRCSRQLFSWENTSVSAVNLFTECWSAVPAFQPQGRLLIVQTLNWGFFSDLFLPLYLEANRYVVVEQRYLLWMYGWRNIYKKCIQLHRNSKSSVRPGYESASWGRKPGFILEPSPVTIQTNRLSILVTVCIKPDVSSSWLTGTAPLFQPTHVSLRVSGLFSTKMVCVAER